jgi:tetratricopeptide (TPR) repeat protein
MFQTKNSNKFLLPLAVVCFALALYIHQSFTRPIIHIDKQESATNINRNFLIMAAAGNKRLLSSIIWIQTLLESDLEKYDRHDLSNWMYIRFLTIATLNPRFYENYLWGGMYLSIIKDDLEGAADIYERGLEYYPDDYQLLYNASFNYYVEMGNYQRGLALLEKLLEHPQSPHGLKFIINKLRYETGSSFESTFNFLKHQLEITKDPVMKNKIMGDIYSLKADHDLKCLNQAGGAGCEKIDAFGNPYLFSEGKWQAQLPFKPYKIFREKK